MEVKYTGCFENSLCILILGNNLHLSYNFQMLWSKKCYGKLPLDKTISKNETENELRK